MPGIVALPRPLSLSARLQLAPLIPTPRLPLRSGREGRGLPGRSRGLEPQAGPPVHPPAWGALRAQPDSCR